MDKSIGSDTLKYIVPLENTECPPLSTYTRVPFERVFRRVSTRPVLRQAGFQEIFE